jgi:hypothetical protein
MDFYLFIFILFFWVISGCFGYVALFFLERKAGYRNYRYHNISEDLRLTVPFEVKSFLLQVFKGGIMLFVIFLKFRFYDSQNRKSD